MLTVAVLEGEMKERALLNWCTSLFEFLQHFSILPFKSSDFLYHLFYL